MTEEINYKELCEEFYKSLKNFRGTLSSNQTNVLEKYEELHKPKMTRYPNGGEYFTEIVNYKNQQYALFWNNWYHVENGKLYQLRDDYMDELNEAYKDYKIQE
jgi:hypothetical protein